MKRRLMKKMVRMAVRHGCLMTAYHHILKYCSVLGLSESDVNMYIEEKYEIRMDKI